jgi:hydroxymethylglutaryl-CoA reductase
MDNKFVEGFSKLSKEEKIRLIASLIEDENFSTEAASYFHPQKQELFDSFSENTLTNYYLPFGIAPNFLINESIYHVPMVVEESSVVAAASSAAKFWYTRGGFQAQVLSTLKKGHIHFLWTGKKEALSDIFPHLKECLLEKTVPLTAKMQQRGGGIKDIKLEDFSSVLNGYYRISVDFDTADSMGANFINSVLESMAVAFRDFIAERNSDQVGNLEIIMSILSNHVPECLVECQVSCSADLLDKIDGTTPWQIFVQKFKTAVDIACIDSYRAATHNKGIMNGVDSVVIATGNDFRAVEAGAHTYASIGGAYKSLSTVEVNNNTFSFRLKMPMALGTVGGLTSLHPMAKRAMQILGNPSAKELMTIAASVGLANNFSAVKALVTKGIQQGHMKMHLSNILLQYKLDKEQKNMVQKYFRNHEITYAAVNSYIRQNFPEII